MSKVCAFPVFLLLLGPLTLLLELKQAVNEHTLDTTTPIPIFRHPRSTHKGKMCIIIGNRPCTVIDGGAYDASEDKGVLPLPILPLWVQEWRLAWRSQIL